MKRIISALILSIFSLTTFACTTLSTTEKYLKAYNTTQSAASMQVERKINIKLDLSKVDKETKDKLENFKEITLNQDEWVDLKKGLTENRLFLKAGEIMIDGKGYCIGGNTYLKTSFTKDKYFKITNDEYSVSQEADQKAVEKLVSNISDLWKNSIEKEILIDEGNTIENTPDGDIKVTRLSVALNDAKANIILKQMAEVIAKDEQSINYFAQQGYKYINDDISDEAKKKIIKDFYKDLPVSIDKANDKFAIEKLKLTAKIDKDFHILNETLEGALVLKTQGEIRINFVVNTKRWNINTGKVNIIVPEINRDNIIETKDLRFENSEAFNELFQGFSPKK